MATRLVGFSHLLRAAGISTSPAALADAARALSTIDVARRNEFRAATRTVFVSRREQLEIFNRAFDAFFSPQTAQRVELGQSIRRIAEHAKALAALGLDAQGRAADATDLETLLIERHVEHSRIERLRRKDFAQLTDDERQQVLRLLLDQPLRLRPRRSRRWHTDPRGPRIDLRKTLRRSLNTGGEVIQRQRTRRIHKPRPVVVLCDLSGSMEAYARIILPFTYTLRDATCRLEVFVFATRLTRVTPHMNQRNLDRALRDTAGAIADWGGGTRIGESFRVFNQRWNRRVLPGGSVVVVVSDAWDRGDPELLGRETARLARSCHRLIWLNPLVGSAGYEPIASGARAVVPHVDDFLPCHDLRSLEQLREILSNAL